MTSARPADVPSLGVRIAGTGAAVPEGRLTNFDLERMMDTSDEWIVQRTGIRERRVIDRAARGESTTVLSVAALRQAMERARIGPRDLDLVLTATITAEMLVPPMACRVAAEVGAAGCGAMDINGACCGFVFGLNMAYGLMRSGLYRCVALVGADTLSQACRYTDEGRGTAILFGDGAGAVILRATDDASKGMIAQAMRADGSRWEDLYMPQSLHDFPKGVEPKAELLNTVQMNGRAVFRFAVGTFGDIIQETLDRAGIKAEDVDHYVCHQSNARILEAARERFGLPPEKLYVNIDRYGNTVAASVPLCLHELWEQGRIEEGQLVMFLAFGGGLTWGSSLWRL